MTTEEKFRAAVNVIRNLPKQGPVQTSHGVMLKFYAYFKQATEGPNRQPKPAFWDVVKKAKWDAWHKLGDMNAQTAMQLYVDEFKKIVETVTKTNADMDKTEIDNFYASVPMNDLELLVGPTLARSRSNSPVQGELNESEGHSEISSARNFAKVNGDETSAITTRQNGNHFISSGSSIKTEDDEEDEFFLDTIENSDSGSVKNRHIDDRLMRNVDYAYTNGYADGSGGSNRRFYTSDHETNVHLTKVITSLQKDLEKVVSSVSVIEQRINQSLEKAQSKRIRRSFDLPLSPATLAVFLAWPVLVQFLFFWFRRRRDRYA